MCLQRNLLLSSLSNRQYLSSRSQDSEKVLGVENILTAAERTAGRPVVDRFVGFVGLICIGFVEDKGNVALPFISNTILKRTWLYTPGSCRS